MAPCPPPLVPTYPFGPSLRFVCSTIDRTLTWADDKFVSGTGEDQLSKWGYYRERDPEKLAEQFYSYAGYSHREALPYGVPYVMRGHLHNLTQAEYLDLLDMVKLWREQKTVTRLYDGRLVTVETKPRARARFNPTITYTLPTRAATDHFFAQYDVIWKEFTDYGRYSNRNFEERYRVDFTLEEWNPVTPIPVAQDLP
jgi:hypothetical protein